MSGVAADCISDPTPSSHVMTFCPLFLVGNHLGVPVHALLSAICKRTPDTCTFCIPSTNKYQILPWNDIDMWYNLSFANNVTDLVACHWSAPVPVSTSLLRQREKRLPDDTELVKSVHTHPSTSGSIVYLSRVVYLGRSSCEVHISKRSELDTLYIDLCPVHQLINETDLHVFFGTVSDPSPLFLSPGLTAPYAFGAQVDQLCLYPIGSATSSGAVVRVGIRGTTPWYKPHVEDGASVDITWSSDIFLDAAVAMATAGVEVLIVISHTTIIKLLLQAQISPHGTILVVLRPQYVLENWTRIPMVYRTTGARVDSVVRVRPISSPTLATPNATPHVLPLYEWPLSLVNAAGKDTSDTILHSTTPTLEFSFDDVTDVFDATPGQPGHISQEPRSYLDHSDSAVGYRWTYPLTLDGDGLRRTLGLPAGKLPSCAIAAILHKYNGVMHVIITEDPVPRAEVRNLCSFPIYLHVGTGVPDPAPCLLDSPGVIFPGTSFYFSPPDTVETDILDRQYTRPALWFGALQSIYGTSMPPTTCVQWREFQLDQPDLLCPLAMGPAIWVHAPPPVSCTRLVCVYSTNAVESQNLSFNSKNSFSKNSFSVCTESSKNSVIVLLDLSIAVSSIDITVVDDLHNRAIPREFLRLVLDGVNVGITRTTLTGAAQYLEDVELMIGGIQLDNQLTDHVYDYAVVLFSQEKWESVDNGQAAKLSPPAFITCKISRAVVFDDGSSMIQELSVSVQTTVAQVYCVTYIYTLK